MDFTSLVDWDEELDVEVVELLLAEVEDVRMNVKGMLVEESELPVCDDIELVALLAVVAVETDTIDRIDVELARLD